jgi:hypothetical protein
VTLVSSTHERGHAMLVSRINVTCTRQNAFKLVHFAILSHTPQIPKRHL